MAFANLYMLTLTKGALACMPLVSDALVRKLIHM